MSKWLEPSGYFGPYFGTEGEAVIKAHATFSIGATGNLTGGGEELTDRQVFRIFNVRKRKKTKIRQALILDLDTNIPEQEDTRETHPIAEPIIQPLKVAARKVDHSRWIPAPVVAVRVAPKARPILPLAVVAEAERKKRKNNALRLLLLAS
jgi:hypothetical protein